MEPGKPGFIAPWELRVGHLRVYYETGEACLPSSPSGLSESRSETGSASAASGGSRASLRKAGKAMKTLEMTEATGDLPSYAEQVRAEPVIVTDRGKPVMALVGITDADLETASLSTDSRFMALIERSRALYKPGTGMPLEEVRHKYKLARKRRRGAARSNVRKRR